MGHKLESCIVELSLAAEARVEDPVQMKDWALGTQQAHMGEQADGQTAIE